MMNYETQLESYSRERAAYALPQFFPQHEEIPMKSASTFVSSPFKMGRFSAALAVLCALMAMTDPAAPDAVKWVGIALIAVTLWQVLR